MVDGDAKGLEGPCCRMKTVFMKPSGDGPTDQVRKLDGSFWKVVLVFFISFLNFLVFLLICLICLVFFSVFLEFSWIFLIFF